MTPYFEFQQESDVLTVSLKADWTFGHTKALQEALNAIDAASATDVTFQCGGLQDIDIAGAWVLFRKSQELEAQGRGTRFQGFKAAHFKFLKNITDLRAADGGSEPSSGATSDAPSAARLAEAVGRRATAALEDIGRIAQAILSGVTHPSRLSISETVRQIDQTGARAVPIVVVISFLMGVVLAYQGANQLASFGAEVFVADLVTVSMLREMGVLLAGIMAAGRSASAFAAAIGAMKLNEEIDALRVMGLNPNHVLIAPRVVALLISLPLLAVFGTMAGIAGGLTLSTLALDMSATQYLERTAASAETADFFVGLVKAPVFALLIAGVGTLRGTQVSGSASQLGQLTTTAVVQSVFLIILADAVFTIVFSTMGI